jgi:hypothetical protein
LSTPKLNIFTLDSEDEYYAKARAAKTRQIEIKKSPAKITLGEAIDRYIKQKLKSK